MPTNIDNLDDTDLDPQRSTVRVPIQGVAPNLKNPKAFKDVADSQVDRYGGMLENYNIQTKPTPGYVKVELRDTPGYPDGIYYLKEEAVDKIIKAENCRRDTEQSDGGVFFAESEVPPINDENRGLTKTPDGLIVPSSMETPGRTIKVFKSTSKGLELKNEF